MCTVRLGMKPSVWFPHLLLCPVIPEVVPDQGQAAQAFGMHACLLQGWLGLPPRAVSSLHVPLKAAADKACKLRGTCRWLLTKTWHTQGVLSIQTHTRAEGPSAEVLGQHNPSPFTNLLRSGPSPQACQL